MSNYVAARRCLAQALVLVAAAACGPTVTVPGGKSGSTGAGGTGAVGSGGSGPCAQEKPTSVNLAAQFQLDATILGTRSTIAVGSVPKDESPIVVDMFCNHAVIAANTLDQSGQPLKVTPTMFVDKANLLASMAQLSTTDSIPPPLVQFATDNALVALDPQVYAQGYELICSQPPPAGIFVGQYYFDSANDIFTNVNSKFSLPFTIVAATPDGAVSAALTGTLNNTSDLSSCP